MARLESDRQNETVVHYLLSAERSSDAVLILASDADGSCLYASARASVVTGLEVNELLRCGLVDLVVPAQRPRMRLFLEEVRRRTDPQSSRFHIRQRTACLLPVHVIARRVLDPFTGEPEEIVASIREAPASGPCCGRCGEPGRRVR